MYGAAFYSKWPLGYGFGSIAYHFFVGRKCFLYGFFLWGIGEYFMLIRQIGSAVVMLFKGTAITENKTAIYKLAALIANISLRITAIVK